MDDNIRTNLITFISTAMLTWIVKSIYDKIFRIKPRLYISTKKVLHMQKNNNYQNFSFTWTCPILIKNNSNFTAERIEFVLSEKYNISSENMNNVLSANNHLESYKEIALEAQFTKVVPYEDVVNTYIEEDGTRVILPGTKMNEPAEFFKPESLKNITIIAKYRSESNKTFYTVYKNRNGKEENNIYLFNPLKLIWFVSLK